MSDEKRIELFKKCLKANPEDADDLAIIFKISKRSLAAYKAHLTMGNI
jgi:hypothetical protein